MMRTQKLSVLIFSRDEVEETLDLVNEIYDLADEIVLIDSSNRSNRRVLHREKRRKGLQKLRMFYVLALGYAEPFRTYGISKCKNEWILLVDTDERLSKELKKNIKSITDNADFDVLKIMRYESGKRKNFFTWQIRLFRKNGIEYLGLTHETPIMHGRVKKLNPELGYINHFSELTQEREYERMNLFETRGTLFLVLRDLFVDVNLGKIRSLADAGAMIGGHLSMKKERTREIKEIGRIIRTQGLIKYLRLDKESTIRTLNRKYQNSEQGIGLLIKLLKDRRNGRYP